MFERKWTTNAAPGKVPSGSYFSPLIGAVHDAGTEDGATSSVENDPASPQDTITSIKRMGKFSDNRIALLRAPTIPTGSPIVVAENETSVATLIAEDDDTDAGDLSWSITSGADARQFTLGANTGVLAFTAAKDFESPDDVNGDGTYELAVEVTDGTTTDTADLEVTLSNVLELATAVTGPASVDFAENRAFRVATYSASSAQDNADVVWSVLGDDAGRFGIDNPGGVLRFDRSKDLPNFEAPVDADRNNAYVVMVGAATSETATPVTLEVAVSVTDANESGTLALDSKRPRVGTSLTAAVVDPDGAMSDGIQWQWERSTGPREWDVIDGAMSSSYIPVAADTGQYLRATATYSDHHATGQAAQAVAPGVVLAHRLSKLIIRTTSANRTSYPLFSADVLHYAVVCNETDTMTLTLAAEQADTRLAVDGTQLANPGANQNVTVTVDVTWVSDVPVVLTDGDGASTTYVVHCLASGSSAHSNPFPYIRATKRQGAWDGLITLSYRKGSLGYFMIVDTNGVPRFRRAVERPQYGLRIHENAGYPYSSARGTGTTIEGTGLSRRVFNHVHDVLDKHLQVVETVKTVAPLQHTDHHDFVIKPNGHYVFLAYEPTRRDLSSFTRDYGLYFDPEDHRAPTTDATRGEPLAADQPTTDSVIQIVDPAQPEGTQEVMRWNSWDHMAMEDCTQHFFPGGYAHLNSLQAIDDDIVASFRGCSQVLRIGTPAGNVVWRLGRSNRSDAEWKAGGSPAPLAIVGDPLGEFCAQHSARILDNGNLVLYDNGVYCLVDPKTRAATRTGRKFSRAVAYAIDVDNGEAIFQQHHSLYGGSSFSSTVLGAVEEMDNGNWLISWGAKRSPVRAHESVTEWNPQTDTEVLSLHIKHSPGRETSPDQPTVAYPLSPEALALPLVPLSARIVEVAGFHTGTTSRPTVVVAFNQVIVDVPGATSSVDVTKASSWSVMPHVEPGSPANAYKFTLSPEGDEPITFALVEGEACAAGSDGGICTARSETLSKAPAAVTIPGPVAASVLGDARVTESASASVLVILSPAHGRSDGVEVPLLAYSEGD